MLCIYCSKEISTPHWRVLVYYTEVKQLLCFSEYYFRFFKFEQQYLCYLSDTLDRGNTCLACPKVSLAFTWITMCCYVIHRAMERLFIQLLDFHTRKQLALATEAHFIHSALLRRAIALFRIIARAPLNLRTPWGISMETGDCFPGKAM